MKFLDYSKSGFGLLVKYSDHYKKIFSKDKSKERYGIVVGKEFVNLYGKVICFLQVHWEGEVASTLVHPVNIVPVRKHNLPFIEADESKY